MTDGTPGDPIPSTARPRLAGGARLQTDRVTGQPVLLFPEGMLKLNPTAAAILELCDGNRSVAEVMIALAGRFNAAPGVLDADVAGYLSQLRRRGLVNWE